MASNGNDYHTLLFQEMEKGDITESERHRKDLLAHYDGEIAYLDYYMGKLFEKLKELGIYDNTMIIITSDHGEFFGEHDYWYHSHELYEEVIKIPLIIKYPGSFHKTGTFSKRVSLSDIMPTILNFLGIPLPHNLQGIDLFEERKVVLAEVYQQDRLLKEGNPNRELKALFQGNYKYIKDYTEGLKTRDELYDMENDSREQLNLIGTMPEKGKEMELILQAWLEDNTIPVRVGEAVKFDQTVVDGLKALGYIQDEN